MAKLWPFKIVRGPRDSILFEMELKQSKDRNASIVTETKTPEEISALILEKLRNSA